MRSTILDECRRVLLDIDIIKDPRSDNSWPRNPSSDPTSISHPRPTALAVPRRGSGAISSLSGLLTKSRDCKSGNMLPFLTDFMPFPQKCMITHVWIICLFAFRLFSSIYFLPTGYKTCKIQVRIPITYWFPRALRIPYEAWICNSIQKMYLNRSIKYSKSVKRGYISGKASKQTQHPRLFIRSTLISWLLSVFPNKCTC